MTISDNMYRGVLGMAENTDPLAIPSPARNPRLENAAHQFEASLMQELLAPLQQDSMSSPDSDGGSGSGDALSSFANEAMARAISDRGGFGIAKQLIEHFEKPSTESIK